MQTLIGLWPIWLSGSFLFAYYWFFYRQGSVKSYEGPLVTLLLEIPRTNDKQELAAEQMFASLHGILRSPRELANEGIAQEHMCFEVATIQNRIRFFVTVPTHLQNFVEGQIYAQYPTVQIYEVPDYASENIDQPITMTSEIALSDNEVLPIKTFQNFEVDPLAGITATLAKLESSDEQLWIQVLARPINDNWHKKSTKFITRIRTGSTTSFGSSNWPSYLAQVLIAPFQPPVDTPSTTTTREITERDQSRISAVEEKSKKLGYQVKIRIVYIGPDEQTARLSTQAIIGTFKQYNTTNLNGFTQLSSTYDRERVQDYVQRRFSDRGQILNIEELASVFHLPHTNVETPSILWASSKTAEPPANLPAIGTVPQDELSPFGTTNFRGSNIQFGIKRSDRGRHLYIIGQTGVGKSGLLELLTLSDVYSNNGFAVIDPHGDYAQHVLEFVPANRVQDVVYFNPADREFPIGFNPLEVTDPSLKNHISSELVGVLKRMFESWGPRLEYILRYTILALLDYPGSTMIDITRMLTDKKFRNDVISHIQDPVVRNFWTVEFASWNEKFATESFAPVLNKVGAFTANPLVRNIVGQKNSTMNIRSIMDNGKILIVNLSRGLVGEDNAAILGALMVTKIQLAAMSRADIENVEDRKPFYLYVDEFQNFATDSFATILSEARKYGLNLTVANQYTSQMEDTVKDAVFGNVGAIISFRVGAEDADVMGKYFEPQFEPQDIVQLHNRSFVASLSIGGEKAPAFSATTIAIPRNETNHVQAIVDHSRLHYAVPREEIEKIIAEDSGDMLNPGGNKGNQQGSNGGPNQKKGGQGKNAGNSGNEQNSNKSSKKKKKKKPNKDKPANNDRNANGSGSSDDKSKKPAESPSNDNKSSNGPKKVEKGTGSLQKDETIKLH